MASSCRGERCSPYLTTPQGWQALQMGAQGPELVSAGNTPAQRLASRLCVSMDQQHALPRSDKRSFRPPVLSSAREAGTPLLVPSSDPVVFSILHLLQCISRQSIRIVPSPPSFAMRAYSLRSCESVRLASALLIAIETGQSCITHPPSEHDRRCRPRSSWCRS